MVCCYGPSPQTVTDIPSPEIICSECIKGEDSGENHEVCVVNLATKTWIEELRKPMLEDVRKEYEEVVPHQNFSTQTKKPTGATFKQEGSYDLSRNTYVQR